MKKWLLMGIACSTFLNGENASTSPFVVGAEYLYWQSGQDDMDYGSTTTTQSVSLSEDLTVDVTNTKIIRSKFKYESGFRTWVGCDLPDAEFNCKATYTYLPNKITTKNSQQSSESISSVFNTLPLSSLESKWSSSFNQFDIDFSKTIDKGAFLELSPHVGVRGVIADQRFNVRSDFVSTVTSSSDDMLPVGTNATLNELKQKFYGIGLEAGLQAAIHFDQDMSFVGHCGGAILYSKFKIKNDYEAASVVDGSSTPTALSYAKDTIWAPTPVFDYFIGLNYTPSFYTTCLDLHIGWEQHVFFNMNRLQVGGNQNGNFSTAGLTFGINYRF